MTHEIYSNYYIKMFTQISKFQKENIEFSLKLPKNILIFEEKNPSNFPSISSQFPRSLLLVGDGKRRRKLYIHKWRHKMEQNLLLIPAGHSLVISLCDANCENKLLKLLRSTNLIPKEGGHFPSISSSLPPFLWLLWFNLCHKL